MSVEAGTALKIAPRQQSASGPSLTTSSSRQPIERTYSVRASWAVDASRNPIDRTPERSSYFLLIRCCSSPSPAKTFRRTRRVRREGLAISLIGPSEPTLACCAALLRVGQDLPSEVLQPLDAIGNNVTASAGPRNVWQVDWRNGQAGSAARREAAGRSSEVHSIAPVTHTSRAEGPSRSSGGHRRGRLRRTRPLLTGRLRVLRPSGTDRVRGVTPSDWRDVDATRGARHLRRSPR